MRRCRTRRSRFSLANDLILQEREDIVALQLFAALKEAEFDDETRDPRPSRRVSSTSLATAEAVPPVARTSSITRTFCPGSMASACISSCRCRIRGRIRYCGRCRATFWVCERGRSRRRGRGPWRERKSSPVLRCRQRYQPEGLCDSARRAHSTVSRKPRLSLSSVVMS